MRAPVAGCQAETGSAALSSPYAYSKVAPARETAPSITAPIPIAVFTPAGRLLRRSLGTSTTGTSRRCTPWSAAPDENVRSVLWASPVGAVAEAGRRHAWRNVISAFSCGSVTGPAVGAGTSPFTRSCRALESLCSIVESWPPASPTGARAYESRLLSRVISGLA
ncbi:hypothetical protein JGS39_14700 [Streptomyces sp. P01-B04]|uniref:hypothetical protein n=1 Tax=Streptomyces poriferorum TaxID=2798799 RepID=UPI001C5FE76A|nr:hypothetical protein [Streptomyces poriferorum]MBW5250228.1 hypothetical protein [Streptomyces poriferorum]MBW5259792.1 hypothetical protein [Streptomyces poriferorum]